MVQLKRHNSLLSIAALVFAAVIPMSAADAFYLGAYKIVSAAVAPWYDEPSHKPSAVEMRGLVGKTVTITPKSIAGPRELTCKSVRYQVKDYPADMLFQGAFGEMQRRDKSVDPSRVAAKVGFHGSSWKTLETGCEIEIDYHFIDPTTAAFGLNDYIYILKKQ